MSLFVHVLLRIDYKTMSVVDVDVYSEESPTTMPGYFYTKLFKLADEGEGFSVARERAIAYYRKTYPVLAEQRPIGEGPLRHSRTRP